jgi:streptogramin lyase
VKIRDMRSRVHLVHLLLTAVAMALAVAAFALTAGAAEEGNGDLAGLRDSSRGSIGIAEAQALPAATGGEEGVAAAEAPPENTGLPKAAPAAPLVGIPVSASTGTWENDPTTFKYQWFRCDATGGGCVAIAGATKRNYSPVDEDLGHALRVAVKAQNSSGEATATSDPTEPVREKVEYSLKDDSKPSELTVGQDGDLWYVNDQVARVGKIATDGSTNEYAIANGGWLSDLATGSDGIWYSNGYPFLAGKITTSGDATNYPLADGGNPSSIGVDSANQAWVTFSSSQIAKLDSDGDVSDLYPVPADSTPQYITLGAEDEMWFANTRCGVVHPGRCAIGKITDQGEVTEFDVPKVPQELTLGPDGNMWFTQKHFIESGIGSVTPSGTITEFDLPPGSEPKGIVAGPDGNLWFALREADKIGRITPTGTIEEFPLPEGTEPIGVAAADNYIWYTARGTGKVGKIGEIVP